MITPTDSSSNQHAIVIGGGMAGLLAGRVLADHFHHVTIIERDPLPDSCAFRLGVPQGRHLHILLQRGRDILEQLFPGLQTDLLAAGAVLVDMADDAAWFYPTGWGVRFASEMVFLSCSRPMLEWAVWQRVAVLPQVHFLAATEVQQLIPNPDNTAIAGLTVRYKNRAESQSENLFANLIVDASGRRSRTTEWLKLLGYGAPTETVIDAHLGYATRRYKRPTESSPNWKGLYIQTAPPHVPEGCALLPIENDQWIVTLVGVKGNYPPSDDAGFLNYARNLRSPALYDAIQAAEPLSPIYSYRATENRWRHYEKMARLPENFVILGDAVCAFNPIYGQGMSAAAIGALALDECLRHSNSLIGLAATFQKRLAKLNAIPWQLATSEDYRYLSADQAVDIKTRFMQRYTDHVMHLSVTNPKVRAVLLAVLNLTKPPIALFQPLILKQVIWQFGLGWLGEKFE